MTTAISRDDSSGTKDAAQLATLAREAHAQNRTRECLSLVNQLLLCDPGNSEAQTLKAAVFSDMEQDLSDARILLADSQSRDDGHKYRKAAELILLKILYLDPTHTEAKALLATARASAEPTQPVPVSVSVEQPKPKPPVFEEVGFTAQPKAVEEKVEKKKVELKDTGTTRKLPVLLAAFVLLTGGGLFLYRPHFASFATVAEVAAKTPAPVVPEPAPVAADAKPIASDSSQIAPPPIDPHNLLAAAGPSAASPSAASQSAAGSPAAPSQAAPGFLAINSPISAEIYMGGKLLGETPTTLQLPAGAQTLEYRHGDLRTVMTHDIKSKETVTALVSFELTVQINARPWAQVFIDGTVRKPLGQTPLSSVRVPLGSVLAFENPNFPSKSHRVTETDSSIQVVFP